MVNRKDLIYEEKYSNIVIVLVGIILIALFSFVVYKATNKEVKSFALVDEANSAMRIIEEEITNVDEIVVNENIYNIDNYCGKELFRLIEKDKELIYLQVNINNEKEQLWQVEVAKNNNYITGDSLYCFDKKVLINDIVSNSKNEERVELNLIEWIKNINFISLV